MIDHRGNTVISGVLPELDYRFVLGRITSVAAEAGRLQEASPRVSALLGEALLAAHFVATHASKNPALKISLHFECEGPVERIIAFGSPDGVVRGHASPADANWEGPLDAGKGAGILRVNRWLPDGGIYSSAVEMRDVSLDRNVEELLARSEQIQTFLRIEHKAGHVSGVQFQALPEATNDQTDLLLDWLGGLSPHDLVEHFLDESGGVREPGPMFSSVVRSTPVRVMSVGRFQFKCDCDRSRVEHMLITLGKDSVDDLLEQQGKVEVFCEFCRRRYEFSDHDVKGLFAEDRNWNTSP